MRLDDGIAHRKANARVALRSVRHILPPLVATRKERLQLVFLNAASVVHHFKYDLIRRCKDVKGEGGHALCVTDGVFQQIEDDLLDQYRVHGNDHNVLRHRHIDILVRISLREFRNG